MGGRHLRASTTGADLGHVGDASLRQHGVRATHARRRPAVRLAMAKRLGIDLRQKPVASIGLGPLRRLAAADGRRVRDVCCGRDLRAADGDHEGRAPGREGRPSAGWGEPDAKRALSEAVAAKVTDILVQNALYGTGAGSGDGIHATAGKTGTTEDHADAWYVGYTRDLSTAVWMGYPRGEIPMVSVHGQTVAGSTFPVPIWHPYMSAAEWRRPARPFLEPSRRLRTASSRMTTGATPHTRRLRQQRGRGRGRGRGAGASTPTAGRRRLRPGRRRSRIRVAVAPAPRRAAGQAAGSTSPRSPLGLRRCRRRPTSSRLTRARAGARAVEPLEAEDVGLDVAAGRVLAEDARSAVDLPPFPSSAMDGFALRAADAPGTLPVVARIAAGPAGAAPSRGG